MNVADSACFIVVPLLQWIINQLAGALRQIEMHTSNRAGCGRTSTHGATRLSSPLVPSVPSVDGVRSGRRWNPAGEGGGPGLVGAAGIEPATIRSQSRYATAALRPGFGHYSMACRD